MTFVSKLRTALVAFIALTVAISGYLFLTAPKAQALESLDSIQSGDLIRGETFSAVYFMGEDGFRYVFPNDKAYFTWYDNFDDVKFISDADLAKIQIGGNVTYRPGLKMVKINSDARTYAVAQGGTLRHVETESVAISLYGSDWNTKIDDVPDGFFTNYTIGDPISSASDFDPAAETASVASINDDKGLQAPAEISITDSGYSPLDVTIEAGESVKFTNNGTMNHTATGEDLTWGTGTVAPGGTYIQTFDEAGTFPFFDSYDSANTGAIFVN